MFVTQKCQYAIRAIFEIAKRESDRPVTSAVIARAQAIPPRFLEAILNELKQARFVRSRKGRKGGYSLNCSPASLSVGDIVRFIQGEIGPVDCVTDNVGKKKCPLHGGCVFLPMWEKAGKAISNVYNNVTIKDLVEQDKERSQKYVPYYNI